MTHTKRARWLATSGFALVLATACQAPSPSGPMADATARETAQNSAASSETAANRANRTLQNQGQPEFHPGIATETFRRMAAKQREFRPKAFQELALKRLLQTSDSGAYVSTFAGPFTPTCTEYEGHTYCNFEAGYADGPASSARFTYPWGMAFDSAGNLYVADAYNHRIRKITPAGLVSTVAGGEMGYADGVGTSAKFNAPWDIAVDAAGNIYVADAGNNRIRQITPSGAVTTVAGSGPINWESPGTTDGPALQAKFWIPTGLDCDTAGNIYIADEGNSLIRKLSPDGNVTTIAGGEAGYADGTGAAARFWNPMDLVVDPGGNLFVADYANYRVRKVTPAGVVTTVAGNGVYGFADGPASSARFTAIGGIARDACGNLFVSDESNYRVRKIGTDGQVSTIAGTGVYGFADGPVASAQFAHPEGLALDKNGNLFVSEIGGYRIRKVSVAPCSADSQFKGEEDSNAFSPNGDGTKDTFKLEVVTEGAWTLEVDGHPGTISTGPGENTGNKTFAWDGKVNGINLPDGKHTLRLKSGNNESTFDVVIDTQKPFISSASVSNINSIINEAKADYKEKTEYSFDIKLNRDVDPEIESEIDLDSVKASFEGGAFIPDGAATKKDASTIVSKQTVQSKDSSVKELRFSFRISDKAGNSSDLPLNTQGSFSAKIDVPEFSFTYDEVQPSTGYRLQAAPPRTKYIKDVYYARSGVPIYLNGTLQVNTVIRGLPGSVPVVLENKTTRRPYRVVPGRFITGAPPTPHSFRWTGTDIVNTGQVAPEGRYRVFIDDGKLPGVAHAHYDVEFLVSDKPCIKREDWMNGPVAYTNLERGAHILDGHILTPILPHKTKPYRTIYDWFGTFDGSLSYIRPNVQYTDKHGQKVIEPYDEKFALDYDKPAGFPQTTSLMIQDPFTKVMRIAHAVRTAGIPVPRKPNKWYSPVTLSNKKVAWFYVINGIKASGVTPVHTTFPFYRTQDGIDGQSEYEKDLLHRFPQ